MSIRRRLGIITAHRRSFLGLACGLLAYWFGAGPGIGPFPGFAFQGAVRMITAWDCGGLVFLLACTWLFATTAPDAMPANADQQQEGEWTIFAITLLGVAVSFAAIVTGFSGGSSGSKDLAERTRELRVGLVAVTLLVSWLVMQVTFAMRYAHEFYTRSDGVKLDGGLEFPSDDEPDYWDFLYFSVVLGMTFQVSDVQISSRTLRRLATAHGFLGFVFNTVIIAVTVNIASGFLS